MVDIRCNSGKTVASSNTVLLSGGVVSWAGFPEVELSQQCRGGNLGYEMGLP